MYWLIYMQWLIYAFKLLHEINSNIIPILQLRKPPQRIKQLASSHTANKRGRAVIHPLGCLSLEPVLQTFTVKLTISGVKRPGLVFFSCLPHFYIRWISLICNLVLLLCGPDLCPVEEKWILIIKLMKTQNSSIFSGQSKMAIVAVSKPRVLKEFGCEGTEVMIACWDSWL